MRHVAAYLLAALGGNENPSASDIKEILSSVGVEEDAEALKVVLAQLKGKNLEELIEEGSKKLATMPSGGGGGGGAAAAGGAAAPAGGDGGAKKEEKKEEPEEESDDDMGMGLFD